MLLFVLVGDKIYQEIVIYDDVWYVECGVMCWFGEKVVEIDCDVKIVIVVNGDVLVYDKLIFGIGFNLFIILLFGYDLDGVIVYCDLEDIEKMMVMGFDNKVVVIGGGLLGFEVVVGMVVCGVDVIVVYIMGYLME